MTEEELNQFSDQELYVLFKTIFESANKSFLMDGSELFITSVSERCLCAELKGKLEKRMGKKKMPKQYKVDVEYNRNGSEIKTIIDDDLSKIQITCDLIIHSRGKLAMDNLLALEMKKSYSSKENKEDDKKRLIALTREIDYEDMWSVDGIILPKNVCGYKIGIYYEVNVNTHDVYIEYYYHGMLKETCKIKSRCNKI